MTATTTSSPLGPAALHSALGASSAERWFTCAASARLCASLPADEESVYAREGTRAHALAQHCLEHDFLKASTLIGQSVPGLGKDTTPVSEDMAEAVQVYIDTVQAMLRGNRHAKLYVEQKFKLPFLGPDIDGSIPGGTNDACVLYTDTGAIDVVDYKHGAGKFVSVKGNKQLLYYSLGAQAWFAQYGVKVTAVRITIVQPRCEYSEDKVRSETISLDELWDFRDDAIAAAHAARKPDAVFTPGQHCRGTWCKGAMQMACSAFKEAATKGLITKQTRKSADFMLPAVNLNVVTAPDPTTMDAAALGEALTQAELLDDYLKCLREHATAEADKGRMPRGWRWGEGRGSREWTKSEGEVLAALQRQTNSIDFAPRKLVSVPQAEKLLGEKKFQSAELAALWTKQAGKRKLVQAD